MISSSFYLLSSFQQVEVNKCFLKCFFYKICQWLDSNLGPLLSEVTALPTVPQPLPINIKNTRLSLALCGQSYKQFTLVKYDARVVLTRNLLKL